MPSLPFSTKMQNTAWFEALLIVGLINEGNGGYAWHGNDNDWNHSVWYIRNISSEVQRGKDNEINNI